jgi:DNA-binding Lrp family transcriptional regulator
LLALLQQDARLTNNEISERINLSPSQCSRRRARLEEEGIIRAYRAELDREKLDLGIVIIVTVTPAPIAVAGQAAGMQQVASAR